MQNLSARLPFPLGRTARVAADGWLACPPSSFLPAFFRPLPLPLSVFLLLPRPLPLALVVSPSFVFPSSSLYSCPAILSSSLDSSLPVEDAADVLMDSCSISSLISV